MQPSQSNTGTQNTEAATLTSKQTKATYVRRNKPAKQSGENRRKETGSVETLGIISFIVFRFYHQYLALFVKESNPEYILHCFSHHGSLQSNQYALHAQNPIKTMKAVRTTAMSHKEVFRPEIIPSDGTGFRTLAGNIFASKTSDHIHSKVSALFNSSCTFIHL